jgi:murein DD-endopeptidase MepM/ murein hydrolase activator NlpD
MRKIPLLAALLITFNAHAARPPAGHDPEAASPPPARDLYFYRTTNDLLLQGLVADEKVDGPEALPMELSLRAGTRFRILDRLVNEEGDHFAKVEFEAADNPGDFNDRFTYWVDENELVKGLYGAETAVEGERLNLDTVSPALARFEYLGAVSTAGPEEFIIPIKGARRTSPPGMRLHPILKRWKMHNGWDFAAPAGTPVMAAASGKVTQAGWVGAYGKAIYIDHGKIETRYAHLSAILVKKAQLVKQAQVIGKVGSTGRSTGNHLHYERRGPGGRVLDVPAGRR